MILRSTFVSCALVALTLSVPRASHAQKSALTLGTTMPSAMVHTLDGKAVDLAVEAKGPSVVWFWAIWCESSEHQLPAMKRAAARYGNRAKFVAVSVNLNQSAKRVALYVAKHGVPGEQLFDTNGDATSKWNVESTSYIVVLDKNGTVVYTGIGGDQNIDAAIKKAL